MTEFSTSENNIPAFLIPTKDLDIKLLSIWLFWITACTHVKREREGFEGLQTVRLPYSNPLLLLLFLCCLISFCFSQFPPFTNTHLPIFPLLSFASLSSAYRVFSHDVTAAILVSQNNETAAMLVSQTSPLGVELFSYANSFFCPNKFAYMLATWVKTLYRPFAWIDHVINFR